MTNIATTEEELHWQSFDVDTLQPDVAKKYMAYKAQYQLAKAARLEFETAAFVASELPPTHRLAFNYRFGDLSMAVALAKPKASKGRGKANFASLKAKVA